MHAAENAPVSVSDSGMFEGADSEVGALSWLCVLLPFSILSEIQRGEMTVHYCPGDTCLCIFAIIRLEGVSPIG